jgi:hypothetical protein
MVTKSTPRSTSALVPVFIREPKSEAVIARLESAKSPGMNAVTV